MSDQPFRVEKTDGDSGSVKVGDLSISFAHTAEKDWITYQLTKAERRASGCWQNELSDRDGV